MGTPAYNLDTNLPMYGQDGNPMEGCCCYAGPVLRGYLCVAPFTATDNYARNDGSFDDSKYYRVGGQCLQFQDDGDETLPEGGTLVEPTDGKASCAACIGYLQAYYCETDAPTGKTKPA